MTMFKRFSVVISLIGLAIFSNFASATTISVGNFSSSLTGTLVNDPGPDCSLNNSCLKQTYDTTNNLAFFGTTGIAAIASSVLSSHDPFHDETNINDGSYGNGSSWIGNSADSWVKIDLGYFARIDQLVFGRYRVGACCSDRQAGFFTIETALTDDIFANGNSGNDNAEYAVVVNNNAVSYTGGQSVKVDFNAGGSPQTVTARFLKFTFANSGTAIDEIEVYGTRAVSSPTTLMLFFFGLVTMLFIRRRVR